MDFTQGIYSHAVTHYNTIDSTCLPDHFHKRGVFFALSQY